MPTIIIKPDQDRDLYVAWSTVVEAPVAWGSRAETLTWLAERWQRDFPDQAHNRITDPEQRLRRVDATGTSAAGGFSHFGAWDAGLVYEQRGVLPRRHLARACELIGAGRESEVWDLLEPFEDLAEVRRG